MPHACLLAGFDSQSASVAGPLPSADRQISADPARRVRPSSYHKAPRGDHRRTSTFLTREATGTMHLLAFRRGDHRSSNEKRVSGDRSLEFDEEDQARMREQAERNQERALTSEEQEELQKYVKRG